MSAQNASAPVRFARIAAAAALLLVTAAVVIRLAGRRAAPPPAARVEFPPADRVVDLKERVRHQEFKEGRAVADIRGDRFFRGPDGRNHLAGAIEITSLGPAGETVSRLTAGEVVYDPGSLRFTVAGNVRVEAGGVVLAGDAFDYDREKGLFETKTGGRFSSKTMTGRAGTLLYTEGAGEIRLGGGFRVELGPAERPDEALDVSGDSFLYVRPERRGRIDGRASIGSADFRGTSETVSFLASRDESSFESTVFEGSAEVALGRKEPPGEGSGEIRADRIAVSFSGDRSGLSITASEAVSLAFRSAADRAESVLAPAALLSFDRPSGLWTWSASGGIRAEIADAGRPGRTVEGEKAVFDAAKVLHVSGGSGRPAVADSAEARIEAPEIGIATETGEALASGGVACVLKEAEGRRTTGFFSPSEDVYVRCDRLNVRPGSSTFLFSGGVLVRQGQNTVRAAEIETDGDMGRMSGGGGVAVVLTEAASAGRPGRTIELDGADMAYRPDPRALTLSSKARVRLPEAGLEASTVTAVIGRDGRSVESLAAAGRVVVSKGRYEGRSEAASYEAATERLTLTGNPLLNDGKGGSARGAKLTFDLADDKILIENEGAGRATTVVRS
jgi:lipopolysaccharide export system protein LptA